MICIIEAWDKILTVRGECGGKLNKIWIPACREVSGGKSKLNMEHIKQR